MIPRCSKHLRFLFLTIVVCGCSIGTIQAHDLEIIAADVVVKVGQKTVATVQRGERYKVLRVQLPWVAISWDEGAPEKTGWVLADKVRLLAGAGFDEASAAPESPSVVHAQVDLTQVNGAAIHALLPGGGAMGGRPATTGPDGKAILASYLAFRLTLRNDSDEAIAVAGDDFKLHADDLEIAALGSDDITRIFAAERSVDFHADPTELTPFPAGRLAPGDTTQGWLGFDLTKLPLGNDLVRMPAADRWLLRATLGNQPFELDLKANELRALDATARPAQLDPTIQVVQIGRRLNALNLKQLIATLESLKAEPGVIFIENAACQHDQAAQAFLQSLQFTRPSPPGSTQRFPKLWQVRANQNVQARRFRYGFMVPQPYHALGPAVQSEPLAVIQLLAQRPQSGPQLIKHLGNHSPEVRAAAAQALASHLPEEGVIAGLVAAAKDSDPKVRAAGLRALGTAQYVADQYGRARVSPTPTRQGQSPAAVAAVREALHDPEAMVRQAAAGAANAFPLEALEADLISLLDDKDINVRIAACHCLGQLKSTAAAPRLKEISQTTDDSPDARSRGRGTSPADLLRTAALDALVALEAMSPLDAALAKLERGNPSPQDFAILSEGQDERAVPLLIERVRRSSTGHDQLAIQALGGSGDARAVEPLIELLSMVQPGNDDAIVQALGQLRDRRAIEPLRRRLARVDQPHQQVGYLAALVMVDDPRAVAEVESLLKAPNKIDQHRGGQLLEALGRSGHAKAPDIIEPLLDDPRYCQSAAKAAALCRLPKAYSALVKRLDSAKYPHGAQVVHALAENRDWALSVHGQAMLKSAAQSRNESTRSAASGVLRTLQTAAR